MKEVKFWRAVFSLLLLAVAVFFLVNVWGVLVPFLLGLDIAYLVHPLVDRFVSLGLRRDRTVLVLYIVLLGVSVVLGLWLLPTLYRQANAAIQQVPTYTTAVNGIIDNLNAGVQEKLTHLLGKRSHLAIPFRADKFLEGLLLKLPENLLNVAHWSLWIIIIPFVSFFGLSHGRRWIDLLFQWTPSRHVEGLLGLMAEINATLGGYIRGQFLDAMCVGFVTMAGLRLLGIEGSVLLGVITGLLNLVPFMAPVVGGSLALLTAYLQGQGSSVLVGIFLLYAVVRLLDDFVFIPFIVGHNVRLHPVLMLFAILAGFELGGVLGLIFAVPAAAVVKVVLSVTMRNRQENWLFKQQHVVS